MFNLIYNEDGDPESFELSGWELDTLDTASDFLGYEDGADMAQTLLNDPLFHEGISWDDAARKVILVALAIFN